MREAAVSHRRSWLTGLLQQSLLLLPEPGQRLARGHGVEVETAQRGGELLGWGWRELRWRFHLLAPLRVLFRDQNPGFRLGIESTRRLREQYFGAIGDPGRQARQPRYLDTVGPVRRAGLHRVEEDHASLPLASRDVDVRHPWQLPRDGGQLQVVSSEERPRPDAAVDVLKHRPRDGQAIIGRGAATNFVQYEQRALCGLVQNRRRLDHLGHEGRL